MKICLMTPLHGSWTRQEVSILRDLGHVVYLHFIPWYPLRVKRLPQFRVISGLYENVKLCLQSIPACLKSDLIFCWFVFPTGVFAVLLGKLLHKPVLLNAVGYDVAYVPAIDYGSPSEWYYRPFVSWALRNATKVIAISKESARWAGVWGAKDVTVIYEGIDTEKFKPLSRETTKGKSGSFLLAVSQLEKTEVKRKGLECLLKSLPEVVNTFPDVKLVIVGKKYDAYPTVQRITTELKMMDYVVFKDLVSDSELLELYNRCDIFVLPSLHEGFPTVCAEAQACEKPVVSTNVSSMPEVLENNVTGLLVAPNDPGALANAVKSLLSNPELRRRFGKLGRKRVIELFSKEIRRKKLQEVLIKLG